MKQPIILVNKHGRPSMKGCYQEIRQDANFKDIKLLIKSSRFDGYVQRQNGIRTKLRGVLEPDCRNSIVIRWGSRCPIVTDERTVVYNTAEALSKANDKPLCRRILQDAGIAVPKTYFPDSNFDNAVYPLLSRRKMHGQGKDVVMAKNYDHVQSLIRHGYAYFSEFYPKTREIRVHTFMNKIIGVVEKPKPKDNKVVWNRAQNSDPFQVLDRKDWPMDACLLALEATDKLSLDFSGTDILLEAGEGYPSAVICEINSSPTINSSPYIQSRYIKAFKWLLSSDKRRPKWNYKKFKNVESLAIKNFQMEPQFEIPEEFCLN